MITEAIRNTAARVQAWWKGAAPDTPESGTHPVVIRAQNPMMLMDEGLFQLLTEALVASPLSEPKRGVHALFSLLGKPHVALLCVYEEDRWCGMAVLELSSGLLDGAFVLHFFNNGSAAAEAELKQVVRELAVQNGAKKLFVVDSAGAFEGRAAQDAGRLMQFDLTEDG